MRWGDETHCLHCGSTKVSRKADGDRIGRWNCHDCKSSFNVMSGTIFEKTKLPLQKWFLAVGLVVNTKKSISSWQLSRDLDMNQKSAWYMQQRIHSEMAREQQDIVLQGVVEVDETYIGGKPRKGNKREDDKPSKRGRGTSKTPVMGVVERGGNVAAKVADNLNGKTALWFIQDRLDSLGSLVMTDELSIYNAVGGSYPHSVVNHSICYVEGETHINNIESFWSLVKRAWFGSHHHYTRKWLPLYIAESTWKYNNRRNPLAFADFIRQSVS